MSGDDLILDLAAAEAKLPQVKLPGGRIVELLPLDAVGHRILHEVTTTKDYTRGWDVVARCLPADVPRDEVDRLTLPAVVRVLNVLVKQVEEAQALLGKGGAPPAS